tara:strand:- start:1260 stop:1487 length:228 start_codon:yes stop_codon:yes gene_type:complete
MSKILINGVERDMTPEEQTVHDNAVAQFETEQAEAIAKFEARATNQASGNQKLLDLGLTQAEATALTGYTPPEED